MSPDEVLLNEMLSFVSTVVSDTDIEAFGGLMMTGGSLTVMVRVVVSVPPGPVAVRRTV